MKQIKCERVGAKKRTYDQGKTPFQRLLEQPFEDRLEERWVKMAALALKNATDLVEQKVKMDRAVDSLLNPPTVCRYFRIAEQEAMVKFNVAQHGGGTGSDRRRPGPGVPQECRSGSSRHNPGCT
jgi:hypothetical protein